jgi:hypothetical protein
VATTATDVLIAAVAVNKNPAGVIHCKLMLLPGARTVCCTFPDIS